MLQAEIIQTNSQKNFVGLLSAFNEAIKKFPDRRTGLNLQYTMHDIAMGAFSVFFTQSPSFLSHQKLMQETKGINNAETIFGIDKIPCDNHIRHTLDEVEPSFLYPVFDHVYSAFAAQPKFDSMVGINGTRLLAMDATWYFSSGKISCQNCSTIEHKNGEMTHYHSAITPVIVTPNINQAIPLRPEFITPQDGHTKQDCETAAGKRWIESNKDQPYCQNATILGDDLYSRLPFCQKVQDAGMHFLLVCKPDSHKTLTVFIEELKRGHDLGVFTYSRWTGKQRETLTYRYANEVPLTDAANTIFVNWCELTITDDNGVILYRNAFITDHTIDADNVESMVISGRTRWKIENENNNTLKTKGYHLEHNFGHGKKYLSSLLATLNILAFLFHTFLEFVDEKYQQLRKRLPTRAIFFEHLRAITCYWCFKSWQSLLDFMLDGLDKKHTSESMHSYCR